MKKNTNIAIQLTHVGKKYEIHHEKPTLVEKFINGPTETFWALKDISLTINKGEKVGIIGPNGSGKTTLLKTIVGITTPTTGNVVTSGKIISIIDLEAGFHAELTGEQNIYLNGMFLGMSKSEVNKKLMKIIRFADIAQFIDAPLFTYSAGMKLRLGFSVAVHADPDILILDESMLTGDEKFHRKTVRQLNAFVNSKLTVIIVSHFLEYIKNTCKRVILIKHGKIIHDDGIQILDAYKKEA
jgi:ABC-type polysaccharide/polyol phosphate transport system ATPase subunit